MRSSRLQIRPPRKLEVTFMISKVSVALALWGAAIPLLTACTSLSVMSDVNPELQSGIHCHSFAWAGTFRSDSPLRGTIANPLNESRLRTAIASSLQTKGLQPATADAECLVGYGIGIRNVMDGVYPYGWGGGWGWRYGYVGGWGTYGPYVYREGIVAVDLYDARSRQPIWHASVDQNLSGATGEKADQKIKAAVAAIFTKYPG
jgi:hypothetical protein